MIHLLAELRSDMYVRRKHLHEVKLTETSLLSTHIRTYIVVGCTSLFRYFSTCIQSDPSQGALVETHGIKETVVTCQPHVQI